MKNCWYSHFEHYSDYQKNFYLLVVHELNILSNLKINSVEKKYTH